MTILSRTPLIVNNLRFIDTISVFHYSCVIENHHGPFPVLVGTYILRILEVLG